MCKASALSIERNISNVISNPNLFNVSPLVEFERLRDVDDELVIRVWVPMGPSLYTFKGTVHDRVADADVRVKSAAQIISMMARKQSYYSERTVYSWVTEDDLEMGLLDAVRDALRANDADHYDDRLVCRSNLARAYDELVGFCEKRLPDSFVLDGGSARVPVMSSSASSCATDSSTGSSSVRTSPASRLTERASTRETRAVRSSPAP